MSVPRFNVALVVVLHLVAFIGALSAGAFLTIGYGACAIGCAVLSAICETAILTRSIRLQEENVRLTGDFLDAITPTIHSARR